jgi:soluble lytic murein transglycosylase-like protein
MAGSKMTHLLLLCQIYLAAISHGIQPEVAVAQVFVESSFRPQVVNKGCYGLCQVSLATWKSKLQLDPKRMTEVAYNLDAGMTILRHYLDKTGDIEAALYIYNNGYKGKNNKYVPQVRAAYRKIYGREM